VKRTLLICIAVQLGLYQCSSQNPAASNLDPATAGQPRCLPDSCVPRSGTAPADPPAWFTTARETWISGSGDHPRPGLPVVRPTYSIHGRPVGTLHPSQLDILHTAYLLARGMDVVNVDYRRRTKLAACGGRGLPLRSALGFQHARNMASIPSALSWPEGPAAAIWLHDRNGREKPDSMMHAHSARAGAR